MTESKPVELTLNDLVAMKSLIELVTQRGAFKASELSSVGVLFDKLNTFLTEAQKSQSQSQSQEQEDQNG